MRIRADRLSSLLAQTSSREDQERNLQAYKTVDCTGTAAMPGLAEAGTGKVSTGVRLSQSAAHQEQEPAGDTIKSVGSAPATGTYRRYDQVSLQRTSR